MQHYTMMTQDRAAHAVVTLNSSQNFSPPGVVYQQHHLHSQVGDKSSPSDGNYTGTDMSRPGLLGNGDIGSGSHSYLPLIASGASLLRDVQLQGQGMQNSLPLGLTLIPHPIQSSQSMLSAMSPQPHQVYAVSVPDTASGQQGQKQVLASSQSSPRLVNGDVYEVPTSGTSVGNEDSLKTSDNTHFGSNNSENEYSDDMLAPIRKQMQFYFSSENLPNDKFLNQNMDMDKFIPLDLFLEFGRIKPICSSLELLTKAVESSSVLELSEDRKRVRVSQCRKTLTLRGFPQSVTEEDVRKFILEMGADVPTHIEFVMFKEKHSVWYVSFKDEAAARNSFFLFHQKAVYNGQAIGCCIKSSGTLASAGYFPSMEDSNQRRLAYQSQVAAATASVPVHAVQNTIAQPQPHQAQALMQPFTPLQLHSYLSGSPANIYYQQPAATGSYMQYMAGMIHSWPAPNAASTMEPGLIMQTSGLQPQHIRTTLPRSHIIQPGNVSQHRFNRPQRPRQNNVERSASERQSDRTPAVSASTQSSTLVVDSSAAVTAMAQAAYIQRRATSQEEASAAAAAASQAMTPQSQGITHAHFTTALIAQQNHSQQQQHQHHQVVTTVGAAALGNSLDPLAVQHYQAPPPLQHQQHQVMLQAAGPGSAPPPRPTAVHITNPPPSSQHMHHHHHHHIQPPPPIPQAHQLQQQHLQHLQHQHQQQTLQGVGHMQQQQHTSQHYHYLPQQQPQPQNPLLQSHPQPTHLNHHHQQQVQQHLSHHHQHQQQQNSVSPHHNHHHHHQPTSQQQQQQQHHHHHLPLQNHQQQQQHQQQHQHQQMPLGPRPDKKVRRKREDNSKNQRPDRASFNRNNFNSHALPVVDNFTIEANSFPPLPGTQNSVANSEMSHENKMSDVVRGISRNPSLSSSNGPRASSSTPSPVATPAPTQSNPVKHLVRGMDSHASSNGDLALDDDVTSSSQEDVDTDASVFECRSIKADPNIAHAAENQLISAQPRVSKSSTSSPSTTSTSGYRQSDNRQGSVPVAASIKGPQIPVPDSHQQTLSAASGSVPPSSEAPKLSYAQILSQAHRDSLNNAASGESQSVSPVPPILNSGTAGEPPVISDSNTNVAPGVGRGPNQSTGAFREQGNYHGGHHHGSRTFQRGSSKEGWQRSDGPPSTRHPTSHRRNSKENRTSSKFDRRKPEGRMK